MTRSSLSLAEKYDRPVPRYTSYPTAPHFSDAVGESEYRTWLSDLNPDEPLSLYIHVPFCASMCWFCGCNTKVVARYTPIAKYVGFVLEEMALLAAALPQRMKVAHVHWGGGSPTMLVPQDWQRMVREIHRHFDLTEDAELAVELDPRTATEDYVAELAKAGVSRVSIGVQDFDPKVQEAINRIQPYDMTADVVGWLRGSGITAINMDLMYGLPHQTVATVVDQVDLAVSLNPQRIALFGYAHVPWMKTHQKQIDDAVLPDGKERWAQFEAARSRLLELGYVAVGFDHFAAADDPLVQGKIARNFQGYTSDQAETLIGIGASSIGSMGAGYVQNEPSMGRYETAISGGHLPIAKGRALTDEDRARRDVINKLMCDLSVDLGPDATAYVAEVEQLGSMVSDGLVEIDGSRITITEAGRPFARVAASAFDTYLGGGTGRHSKAV
jgi:oxygen-independent coproporphyrinogen III oxidase